MMPRDLKGRSTARQLKPPQRTNEALLAVLPRCPLPAALLILALLIPTDLSFYVGTLRLTPYRILLLAWFVPSWIRILSGRAGRPILADFLLPAYCVWAFVVLTKHHGLEVGAESGGVHSLELLGAYGISRAHVRCLAQLRGMIAFLFVCMFLVAPFTIVESFTGHHILREIGAAAAGRDFSSEIDLRLGFHRAYGPFDHPILYGVFAASMIGLGWFEVQRRFSAFPVLGLLAAIGGAFSSVSSGAMASIMTQLVAILWERSTRLVPRRWLLFASLLLALYALADILSNRSGLKVLLWYLTFSRETAYGRVLIFEWGMENVRANPVFGLGLNDWERPWGSGSMDNFWLVQAVTFGIPGFALIGTAFLGTLFRGWRGLDGDARQSRTGWTISMSGLILAACTVHFWNSAFVYFVFMLGCGVFFINNSVRCPTSYPGVMAHGRSIA